jgi:translation initiation factor 5A
MSVTAVDVLTGRKLEDAFPTSHNVDVPEVKRDEYMVVAVDEPFVSLMLEDGTMKENVMLPENEDLKNKIMEGLSTGTSDVFVQVLSAPIGEDGSTAVLEEMVVDVRIVAAKN